jgi:hypothetical protein
MRLQSLSNVDDVDNQRKYAEMILTIGEGRSNHIDLDYVMEENNQQLYGLLTISRFICSESNIDESGITDAMAWLYPDGFQNVLTSTVLAVTNEQVDLWNERVQILNESPLYSIYSRDSMSEVDDPHGHLKRMLSTNVLNQINNTSVPPHKLDLKVNDICLVTRNLSKFYG